MSWIEPLRSANWNHAAGILLGAYFLGCFTTGYYLVRFLTGGDIRESGSGSVGARNVSRVLGKTGFTLTLLVDFAKGALTVQLARYFTTEDYLVILAMMAVVAGHVWPIQLRFHGGKGMATSLGSLLVYSPELAMLFLLVFLCLFALFRKTVLPGLIALASVPLLEPLITPAPSKAKVVLLAVWAGLVLIAHRKNLVDEFSQFLHRHHQPEPEQPQL